MKVISNLYLKFLSGFLVFGICMGCDGELEVKDKNKIVVPDGMLAIIDNQGISAEDLMKY